MDRRTLARDLAVALSVQFREGGDFESDSERKARKTIADQYLKAAAELAKGNVPIETPHGWIVESRSKFVGRLGTVFLPSGEILDTAGGEVRFAVTGGDVYLYNPDTHTCTCAALNMGCWHGLSVEVYQKAKNMLPETLVLGPQQEPEFGPELEEYDEGD